MRTREKRVVLLGTLALLIFLLKLFTVPGFGWFMSGFTLILMGIQLRTMKKSPNVPALLCFVTFLFVFAGDFFLNFTSYRILHIASFAVALIFIISSFAVRFPRLGRVKPLLLTALLSAVLYGIIVVPALPHKLAVHFAVYLLLLTLMVWRAYLLRGQGGEGRVLFAGALLFYITDILVGVRIIYQPEHINTPIYLLYPWALILLVIAPWFRERE